MRRSSRRTAGTFAGVVHFPSPQGVSVISDIDDTIKISEVKDRKLLLQNTFFRPFQAVPGVPDKYRQWAEAGVAFSSVSASPWQLYDPLANFFRQVGFPHATFHLKRVVSKMPAFSSSLKIRWLQTVAH